MYVKISAGVSFFVKSNRVSVGYVHFALTLRCQVLISSFQVLFFAHAGQTSYKQGMMRTKGSLPLGTPKNSSNSNQVILGYSERRSVAQEIQERKKTQLQGFARKGNETRVIANGVFANGIERKTRNTTTECPGAVHLVNKLQKKFNYLNASDMKKITA